MSRPTSPDDALFGPLVERPVVGAGEAVSR
jgi:hypothetical protein